ncbi:sulfite exporter TauE/SafE family protein [Sanguibacter sp. 25GB23B1]|uniref:sulfite exporter TauE/SafE family protein n=1 Tax=unclassified Sanguibacter TaxID=2645534 RepID=UPI0032AEFDC3
MELSVVVALLLAVLVGISLGLLGGGGSILTVPILTYVLGMDPQEAIAASLFIVGTTSAVSVISHGRAGRVRWRMGLVFGTAGMAGAFTGGLVGGYIPGTVLMLLFAVMMVATATAMIRNGKGSSEPEAPPSRPLARIVLDGFAVGVATGLVGAGGGFLVVPALTLLGGLPVAVAIGTSLLVIAMKSYAGLAGYLFTVQIQWPIVLAFTAIAIAGSFVGTMLAGRIPEKALRKGFGIFVLVMGVVVLSQELPAVLSLVTGS